MNEDIAGLTFEEALAALEETVKRLERGDLSLEESLVLFEKGQELAELCGQRLDEASLRVEQLTTDGELIDISPDRAAD
ncbi:MAG: exodeoxyribonuclease VII small subunit [Candidatus Promineifilaceae bacterium]